MSKASKDIQQQSKLILEELEERRLFSGGIEGLIDPDLASDANAIYSDINGSSTQIDNTGTDAAAAEQRSQEVVFVDAGVDNHQQLVDDLLANSDSSRNIEVVVLDQEKDGIEAISEFLSDRDDLDAVHIISHGDDGSIQLGNTELNADTLEQNNLKVALWANSFAETGDILIYGCNLASTEVGQSLINDISSLTLADVAASDDLTGHESLGGDWDLEHQVGDIEAAIAPSAGVQATYQQILAIINGTAGADVLAGTAGNDTISADAGNDVLVGGGGSDQLLGEAGDDVFRFTGAQDGDIYTVDGGSESDIIDLTEFGSGTVTDDGSTITVDLGDDQSFTINYTNIETVVTADTAGNHGPEAIANVREAYAAGDGITIDGTRSDDFDGDALTYQWTQIGGPAVTLNNANTGAASFTAPSVASPTTYTFQLVVSDGTTSHVDTVETTVLPLTSGGFGSDNLTGTADRDALDGGFFGNDTLDGGDGDDLLSDAIGDDVLIGGAGHDVADYTGAASGVTVDITITGPQATGGAGTDSLSGIEGVLGTGDDDTFAFSNPVDGAVYTVDGYGGFNTIDLPGFASSAVTFGDRTLAVDMGGGQSFTIEYAKIDAIAFSDITATVLSADMTQAGFSGSGLWIDGAEAFTVDLTGAGTVDLAYDKGSDTLSVTGTTGTDVSTALVIEDLNGTDLRIDQVTVSTDIGSITSDANIGTVNLPGGAGVATTIQADVGSLNVAGNITNVLSVQGDVDSLSMGKVSSGSMLHITGSAGPIVMTGDIVGTLQIDGDLTSLSSTGITGSGVLQVGGNAGTITTGDVSGTVTFGGNLTTWNAGKLDATVPMTIAGDAGTITSTGAISIDLTIGGDLDNLTVDSVDAGVTITANQVVGTLVFDVGGTDQGGTYANPVVYVFDGATQTPSATLANDAPTFIDGAVGNWNFDEGSGDSVAEGAVGISTATLGSTTGADANDPTWTTGMFGQALQFDGVDDYVEVADAPGIDISGPEFSASLWVKPDRGPGTEDMFFMKGDRQGTGNVNYYLSWKDSGKMTWAFKSDGGFEYIDMDVTLPTVDEWNHVAVVFDRPTVSIFINGTEYTSSVATGGTMDKDLVANDDPLWIGAGRDGGSLVTAGNFSAPFSGAIDELALFDRALTAAEVEAIRTSAPPVVTASEFTVDENSANNTVVGTVVANDPDVGDTLSYAITAGNTNGAFAIDNNGIITVANYAALDFETTPVFNLTVEATDDGSPNLSGSTTVTISLNNLSDAPSLVNNAGLTAAEGATTVITNAQLGYADAEQPASSIVYSVTSSPANGQLELTTNADVAITSFTQDDIDNSRVVYVHDGSETIADGFNFTVDDGQDNYATGPSIIGIGPLTNVTDGISNARAPDYSPDGSQVVFSRNNDIYIMNADGSNQTPLVTAVGGDFQAVWSPDGSKIAFTSNRDGNNEIYVIDVDGNNENRITTTVNAVSDSAPAWSPDSSKIAFTSDRDGDKEIWVMDADGNNLVQLTSNTAIVDGGASWSPDGSKIVFQSTRDGGDYDIYVMDADGNNQTRLTDDAGLDALGDWSPDGSKILFYSDRDGDNEIYVMDADGNNQVRLTNDLGDDIEAEWSVDGSSILFVSNRDTDYDVYSANVIYENTFAISVTPVNDAPVATDDSVSTNEDTAVVIDVLANDSDPDSDPLTARVITGPSNGTLVPNPVELVNEVNLTNTTFDDREGSWSPDGTKIVFRSDRDGDNEIYVMDADGSNVVQLTSNTTWSDVRPEWSPDGSQIVFGSNRDGNNDIWVMDADGSNQTNLTNNTANNATASWSPDGSKIVFHSNMDGDIAIYVMDADGANQTQITNNTGVVDNGGSFSPDGTQIVFTSDRDGNKEVYVMDANGSNQTRLTTAAGTDGNAVWSPDGNKILFKSIRDGDNEIYVMDADGSNQIQITNNTSQDGSPDWSPDGTRILFHSDRNDPGVSSQIYVADISSDGTFTYTPDAGFTGVDSFTYVANDGTVDSAVTTVTITVDPVDTPAVITGDVSFTGNEGDAVTGTMNATDVDGLTDGTYFSVTTPATNGTAAIDPANGAWTFTPTDSNWFGTDQFTVTVTDDLGGTTTQVVSITLANVNDPPVISIDPSPILYLSGTMAVDPNLTVSDVDNATLQSAQVSFGDGYLRGQDRLLFTDQLGITGSFDLNTGILTLTGSASVADYETALRSVQYEDFNPTPAEGILYVNFSVSDGTDTSLVDTRVLEIVDNLPPRAADDFGTAAEGGSVVIDVAANDTDSDDALDLTSIVITSGPANGSVVVNGDGTVTYTHDGSETASDSFTYTIRDIDGNLSNEAPVSITVTAVNDAPVAASDSYSVSEDATLDVDWFDTNWTARQTLTFDNSAQGETLVDFPVLVVLDSGNIDYGKTQDNGEDLRFFAADGEPLDYDIEEWNEGGTSYVWVKVPQMTAGSNTDTITMYYGNATAAAGEDAEAAWSNGFLGVHHLNDDLQDASGNDNDGVNSGSATAAGQVADGQLFDGVDDAISLGDDASLQNIFHDGGTVSAWIYPTDWGENGYGRIFDKSGGTLPSNTGWALELYEGQDALLFQVGFDGTMGQWYTDSNSISLNQWTHVSLTYDASNTSNLPEIYINGVLQSLAGPGQSTQPTGTVGSDAGYDLTVGNHAAATSRTFDGVIDDVRISSESRSADWVRAQHLTTSNAFVTFGGEETAPAQGGLLGNDTDAENDALTVSLVSGPSNEAAFTLYKNGTFSYTPNPDFNGVDSFTYRVNDGNSDSNTVTVTLNVVAQDDPATITGDTSFSGDEGDAVAGDLDATDVDGLADGTYFSVTTQATSGTAAIDIVTGAWTYTPADPNWFGSDNFTVTVTDDLGGTTTQVVSITLANVNDPVTAVDDSYSVSEDATFSSSSEWSDSNWSYSRTLSFDNSTRTENLVDFPVLVKLDSSVIDYAKTHDQGWDLRFFDQDGTALAHEVELWDEAGTSYVWVKIPQIDASSDTDSIVMYYGNAGVADSGENAAGVWSDYRAAYHLNENPGATGTLADAAGNFDAVNAGSTDTAGIIGNAQDFNGVDQSINLGDDRNWINNASGATLSIWMNADTTTGSGDLIGLTRNDPADTGASRITLIRNGDDIMLIARTMDDSSDSVSVSTTTNPLSAGSWHHITGTVDYASDVDNIKIYVDGQLEGTFSHNFTLDAIPNTDSSHAMIGADEDGVSAFFDGQLDEARIADQMRSADWVSAQYAAMTGTLVDIGAEQTVQGVLINDVDADRDVLTVTELNGAPAAIGVATPLSPSGAIVTLNADGSFTYDTNGAFESLGAGDSTTDSFTYTVIDGNGGVDTATVTMTITGVDDTPTIGGTETGAVQEDVAVVANNISTTGTLTITDPDTGESTFQAETVTGTYGDLTIDTAGNWTYTADNTQAAIQQLDTLESLTDTLTVTSFDGTTHNVVITINGSEDAAVISGTTTGSVTEDGTLTSSGTLTISDTDTSDTPSFADVGVTAGDNGYGTFEMTSGTWTYTLDNNNAAVQALDVGETLTDTHTFTATDGSTQQVTITINGAEDAPVFDSTAVTAATEDVAYSYTITTSDVDVESVTITAPTLPGWLTFVDNGDGTATLSGTPTNAEVGSHNVVLTVSDGTLSSNQNFTIVVGNTNDPAVIGGTDTGAVQEDVAVVANNISTTGTLTITDPDAGESTFQAGTSNGTYGDLTIDAAGNWTYTADNTQAAIQQLDTLESLTDTLTVTSFDGTTHNVVITINGSEDAAVISGTTTGSVTEDGTLTSSGTLTISDTDTSDTPSFADVGVTAGDNGYGTFEMTSGTWTYTLDNNNAAVQALDVGETLTDTHTFTATDGSTQQVTITINGAEDAPVFDSTAVTAATEDVAYSYTITTSDVDVESVTITAPTLPGWLTFVDNGDGTATLSGTPTNAEVGSHNVVLTVSDGTLSSNQNFTIVVGNTNDPAVIGGTDTGAVQEDVAVVANNISTTGTLTITDPDAGESTFQADTSNGTYGDLTIDAAGNWTYTADNTQAAIQQLDTLESLTDTLTVTSFDGTTHNVVITINGSEDAAVISGTTTGSVTEDGTLTSSGTLTISDTDTSDTPSFADVGVTAGDNGYGTFEMTSGTWTYTLDNNNAAVQALDVGETLTDTHTFTATDGSTQQVTITINGAEDAPVIGGVATGTVAEDGTLTASDTLTITDADTSDNPISFNNVAATLGDNGYGDFEITSNTWTYTLNNDHAAVQALDAGQTLTDTYTFTASDGSTQTVTVTINGAEDAPVIGGVATGTVAEDGTLTASDTLTITDADTSDNPISFSNVAATLGDNGYGDFEITSNTWTYTLNNGHAAVQALDAGQTLTDTYTFTASDGSTQTVTVTINGAEDAPVIGGVATGTVAEDGTLTASDTLTITDADTSDNPISFNDVAATLGDNGYGDFEITGNTWTYALNNGHASVQALDAGETLTDTYTFTASDGSTQTVTVTINGAEDAPVIGGVATGTVAEDGTLTASDTLTITDADTSDNPISFSNVAATLGDNGYGDFEITSNTWTYTLNNGHAAVQALDAGETLTDTHTFTATDGSTQQVTITINGAEDTPVFDSTAVTAATEDLAYSYTITTSDVDVESVTITAPTLPAWLTFVDNGDGTATLSGTPTNAEVGSHNVVLTVSDGTLSSNQNFTIIVGNTNDPAVIGGTDTGAVQEDVAVVSNNISTTGTLTITDPDTGESTFQAETVTGTYGDLTIDAAGNWTYTADNTQAAIQQLDTLENITDTLTVTSFDGTMHNVVITINGSEDASVISGTTTGSVTEDGTLTSSGALTISDTDSSDTPSFADVGVTAGDNGYGNFVMNAGTWTYTLNNTHPAVQALDVGETLTDTHTFTATDGSTQQVTITINGAEDTPVFDSTAVTAATEDLAYSYTITTSDVDVEAVTITAPTLPAWLTFVDNGDGTATLSGTPTNAEVGSHNVVLTVSDGTLSSNQNFTIIVGNTNDPAVIGGTDTGAVQEDVAVVSNNISTTGTLTISDPDTGESTFQAETVTGTYGDLTIDAAGNWTYTADNTQAAIQQLDTLENITDTLTVTSFDGTTHNVVITINGSEDAAVISGTTTGSVTEDGTLTSSGTLTITDTDSSDPTSFVDVAPQAGDNGHGTFEITSNTWTYVLDNNDPAVQALDVGETLTDTYTFTAPDGETQLVTVTINGAEDAAVIGGVASGSVTEDGALTVSDILTITDVDSSDNPVSFNDLLPTLGDNGYGNFEITGNTWTYTLNNTHAAVQGLDVGETLTDTYTFIASDGSPSLVIVTIDGAEDLPILGGVTIGAVSEDGPLVTSNTLTITDTDSNDNPISFNDLLPTLGDNGYGNFEITGNTWIFTLNNAHAAVQGLDAGESLSDSFTFTASDGSTQLVSVTINGAEDAPTLDNAIADQTATQSAAFNFTFAANTFGDLDASDTLTYTATLSDSSPLPAWLSFDGATRTFSGTPGAGDVGAIDIRITADDASSTITDTFTLTVDPFNSLPVIGGADRGALTEDLDVVDGQIAASGALTIVDADAGESSFVAGTINGALGSLTIDASGNWSYSADNSNPEIQALQAGQTITEALTVTTADGSTHEVIVTINGTQEAAPPPVVEPPVVEPPPEEEIPPPEEEVKDEDDGGEDGILEEITRLPQGSTPPVTERDESDLVKADEPEGEAVNFGPAAVKQVPDVAQQPQVLQAQNLNVDSLTLQVSDDEALNEQYELELLNRIDSMHLGMDSDGARQSADDVNVQIIVGSTTGLTVGIVSWVLRGGALLASFMSTVPLLNRFDPLPILKTREDKEEVEPDEDDDTRINEHAKKVDNMFSGKDSQQQQFRE